MKARFQIRAVRTNRRRWRRLAGKRMQKHKTRSQREDDVCENDETAELQDGRAAANHRISSWEVWLDRFSLINRKFSAADLSPADLLDDPPPELVKRIVDPSGRSHRKRYESCLLYLGREFREFAIGRLTRNSPTARINDCMPVLAFHQHVGATVRAESAVVGASGWCGTGPHELPLHFRHRLFGFCDPRHNRGSLAQPIGLTGLLGQVALSQRIIQPSNYCLFL